MKLLLPIILLISCLATADDKEATRLVVRSHLKDIRVCYESALHAQPELNGKVVLTWKVNDRGEVKSATVNESQTTLHSTAVSACIIKQLKTWSFPAPQKGLSATINYPFLFSPIKK